MMTQTHKLWGGRFKDDNDQLFVFFNESLSFDYRLAPYDIQATKAFSLALSKLDVISYKELTLIHRALDEIDDELKSNKVTLQTAIESGVEDIHTLVENLLVNKIGDVAYKVNTGRSRNEQVSCATRLWLKDKLSEIIALIKALMCTLKQKANQHIDDVLMGYTHLQQAQPITWGHYFLSFYQMLKRDKLRFEELLSHVDYSPLGLGAIAGNAWQIDRKLIADTLGFKGLCLNSLDAVSDRDYIVEFLSHTSLLGMHLSRLAEDFIIYSTSEFNLIEMSDLVTTGSSLMPQKKNPDAMELVRGKTGRVYGNLMALLTTLKAMPSGYNKDLQEDKELLFQSASEIEMILKVSNITIESVLIHPKNHEKSFSVATELADYLAKKNVPFREAHHIVGEITAYAIENNKPLKALTIEEFKAFSAVIESDVYAVLTIDFALNSKKVQGGTAPLAIREVLASNVE
ncbi:argininosuccinate lyase [Fangia hongkongensis]|uniref:argininosuccinate lyase n=2 Tax=Fangia hongkongensis TaxID=270495 RepID=UPI000477CEDF|nr:argininosuccinate lyase [Fangia hongkongensis]